MSNKFQILKDILSYSTSVIISQGIGIITIFWVARLLGPTDFGILNVVLLVLVYGAYMELGALSTMGRDLPYYLGKGDKETAAIIEGAARRTTIFGAILAAFLVICFSLLPIHSTKMALGLQAMAVALVLQQIYTYHRTVLRSHNCFGELSRQQVFLAVVNSILVVIMVIFIGFGGRLLAAIMAQVIIVFYALRRHPWLSIPKFSFSEVLGVIRIGFPILMAGFILSLLATMDRLLVIFFLGEEQMGYFGLAVLMKSAIILIPAIANQVLYPRITHQFGSSGNSVESLRIFVLTPPVILSALLPLVIGSLYLALPLMIKTFLPAYALGISAARIVVVGIFFFGILGLTDYFLVTTGKLKQYALFGILALFLNISISYFLLLLGYGIEGVAFGGTLMTYFLYSSIIIGYALSHYTKRIKDWQKYFAKLWLPFVYMLALLWFFEKIAIYLLPSIFDSGLLLSTIAKVGGYLLFCLPLGYVVFKEIKIDLSELKVKRKDQSVQ